VITEVLTGRVVLTMRRHDGLSLGILLGAAVGLALFAVAAPAPTMAQPAGEQTSRSATLMHDIQILEMMRSLDMTADQRSQTAGLLEEFARKREAAARMHDSDALIQALEAVRAQLIKGKAPTPAMRQAVQAAQPPDQEADRRASDEAYNKALDGVVGLLTDDQKLQLEMMPLVLAGRDLVGWSLQAQQMPDDEWQRARVQAFGDLRDRIRHNAGSAAQATLMELQRTIDRLHDMPADQLRQQRDQVVEDLVTTLKDALLSTPQAQDEQLRDQLVEWLENSRVPDLLKESAAAMGG
jgi:hypothetical protein